MNTADCEFKDSCLTANSLDDLCPACRDQVLELADFAFDRERELQMMQMVGPYDPFAEPLD